MAWIMGEDGFPTNTDFIAVPEKAMQRPYPDALWRIDADVNDGFPYNKLIPGIKAIRMYIQPARPLIHAYGSREKNFDGNGYAIIEPISCHVRQEENGIYEATFETFCDEYRKFTYLKKQSLVKLPIRYHGKIKYQVFRIRQTSRRMDENGEYRISAAAQAWFYDLNRFLIRSCHPTRLNGAAALDYIFNTGWYGGIEEAGFSYSSDILSVRTAYYDNMSITAALLGADQAFVNRWGGSLYRDNNYFSINQEMEGSRTSGIIMYGYNMTAIEFVEDDTEVITILVAEDNYGHKVTITNPDVPSELLPHHIYRYAKFTYDTDDETAFIADAKEYFDEHKQSKVTITVRFANLTDIDLYADFLQLDDFEVGDRITVYHKDLDIYYSNLKIISKDYDVVNQKTAEIQIGSFKNAVSRRAVMPDTVSSGSAITDKQYIAIQEQVDEVAFYGIITTPIASNTGKLLTTADGKYITYKR